MWQVSQLVGKPDAVWLGLVVFWKSGMWQPEHTVGVPLKTLLTWHCWHWTVVWKPVSGNFVSVV